MRLFNKSPASPDHVELFACMGQALFILQVLEDALSHYIALRKDMDLSKKTPIEEANEYLDKYRSLTLGQALGLVRTQKLLSPSLLLELGNLKEERDWLVHKCMHENLKGKLCNISHCKESLIYRIRLISSEATRLNGEINIAFLDYAESQGIDISNKDRGVLYEAN